MNMSLHPQITLDACQPGDEFTVVAVEGEDTLARRLDTLGFWLGTHVRVVRRAPFGGPVEYALRGFHLALRRSEAERIVVTRCPSPS